MQFKLHQASSHISKLRPIPPSRSRFFNNIKDFTSKCLWENEDRSLQTFSLIYHSYVRVCQLEWLPTRDQYLSFLDFGQCWIFRVGQHQMSFCKYRVTNSIDWAAFFYFKKNMLVVISSLQTTMCERNINVNQVNTIHKWSNIVQKSMTMS